ncbi:MAG: ABC transporter ATP-binding protein [Desulfobacteraceae bacterium]
MLKVDGIDTYYGVARALSGVSLELNEGEIVSLIGANGAGKTTALLTISGLIRPKKGGIYFEDEPIHNKKPSAIVKLGIAHCPEGRDLFPDMSVLDNLHLGAFLRKSKENIQRDLQQVYEHFPRLYERKGQAAGSLSGGEQQMLAIGRALMSGPRLLMLDEPSLGLSPILVAEMFKIVKGINREGRSVLLVEQNAVAALEISKRGYVIETGRIVHSGESRALSSNEAVRKAYLGC